MHTWFHVQLDQKILIGLFHSRANKVKQIDQVLEKIERLEHSLSI